MPTQDKPLDCPMCLRPGVVHPLDVFKYMVCVTEGCCQAAGWMYRHDQPITHWLSPYQVEQRKAKYNCVQTAKPLAERRRGSKGGASKRAASKKKASKKRARGRE